MSHGDDKKSGFEATAVVNPNFVVIGQSQLRVENFIQLFRSYYSFRQKNLNVRLKLEELVEGGRLIVKWMSGTFGGAVRTAPVTART
jgi:hypothetical protein